MRSNTLFNISITVAFAIGLVGLCSCVRVKVTPPVPELFSPAPRVVSLAKLYSDYLNEPLEADKTYGDMELWIESVVLSGYEGSAEKTYLTVNTSQMPATLYDSFGYVITGMLIDYSSVTLHGPQQYSQGDIVEIICTCEGLRNNTLTLKVGWIKKTGSGGVATPGQFSSY